MAVYSRMLLFKKDVSTSYRPFSEGVSKCVESAIIECCENNLVSPLSILSVELEKINTSEVDVDRFFLTIKYTTE